MPDPERPLSYRHRSLWAYPGVDRGGRARPDAPSPRGDLPGGNALTPFGPLNNVVPLVLRRPPPAHPLVAAARAAAPLIHRAIAWAMIVAAVVIAGRVALTLIQHGAL